MAKPFTYRDLETWQLGIDLVEACYKATAVFPKSELYGLTSQLRRASVSIPANVAEGQARKSTKAYKNHVSRERIIALSDSVGRLLNGLHRSLKRKVAERRRNRSVPVPPRPQTPDPKGR